MDFKSRILEALDKLRKKELAGDHENKAFKVRAYATVIKNLNAHDGPIESIDEFEKIKGVGKKIREKVEELIETGDIKQLEKYDDGVKAIADLTKVHGIGPVKAKELAEKHGIKTVDQLRERAELLNDKQKIGLKYCEEFEKRIPRAEMMKHEAHIAAAVAEIDGKLKLEVVGSYRRGAKDSGDIDVILTHEDDPKDYDNIIGRLVEALKKTGYLVDDFAVGPHKYLGVCRLKRHRTHRRIDFLYATKHVWPFSVQYFTGSADFNVLLRRVALDKGLSMSEYGFKKTGGDQLLKLPIYSEEDIFKHLGYAFVPPSERTGKAKDLQKYKLD